MLQNQYCSCCTYLGVGVSNQYCTCCTYLGVGVSNQYCTCCTYLGVGVLLFFILLSVSLLIFVRVYHALDFLSVGR